MTIYENQNFIINSIIKDTALRLKWLAENQDGDGSWSINEKNISTALITLSFESYAISKSISPFSDEYEYSNNVINGIKYLLANLKIDDSGVYLADEEKIYTTSIALAAICASGESEKNIYTNNKDIVNIVKNYKELAQLMIDYLSYNIDEMIEYIVENNDIGLLLGMAISIDKEYKFNCNIPRYTLSKLDKSITNISLQNKDILKNIIKYKIENLEILSKYKGYIEDLECKENINILISNLSINEFDKYQNELTVIKDSSLYKAVVGDIIDIAINIFNNSNTLLKNIVVKDVIDSGLIFIEDSLYIDEINKLDENIVNGVNIGDLSSGSNITITYKVKVMYKSNYGNISNHAYAIYNQCNDNELDKIKTESNINNISIRDANIILTKTPNKNNVLIGDIITYKFIIENKGDIGANNILFIENMPNELSYVDKSFFVEGINIDDINLSAGINIGNLYPGEIIKGEYKLIVIGTNMDSKLENSAKLKYEYDLENKNVGKREVEVSNLEENEIDINVSVFKQINLESIINILDEKKLVDTINATKTNIEILDYYITESKRGQSYEGQVLTGNRIVVKGMLIVEVEYLSEDTQEVSREYFKKIFSTFITLPSKFNENSKISIDSLVDYNHINLISQKTVIVNSTIRLDAKISNY